LVAEHGIRALHHNLDTLQPLDFAPPSTQRSASTSASPVRSFYDRRSQQAIPQANKPPLGRRGSIRSWSAAEPHRRPGRRPCRGGAHQLPGVGVTALEHTLEAGRRCFALQPKAAGAGAVPAARGLAVAGQILFVVGGQFASVILLPPHRKLGDVGHHPAASLPAFVGARERTPGALLSSDEFRVESRAGGRPSSVMAPPYQVSPVGSAWVPDMTWSRGGRGLG
jgi:hypothetical protein